MSDPKKINPSHYELECGIQVYDITKHLDFTTGNVVKYLLRCGNKEGESRLDDLSKARWYLNQLIADERAKDHDNSTEITDPAGIRNWSKH